MPYKHGAPKRFFAPGALLLITLIFASCSPGESFFSPRRDEEIVVPLNLTPFIPKPVAGATPVISFSQGTYTGTVEWLQMIEGEEPEQFQMDREGVFRKDVLYIARVTLTPVTGYRFPYTSVVMVAHEERQKPEAKGEIETGGGNSAVEAGGGDRELGTGGEDGELDTDGEDGGDGVEFQEIWSNGTFVGDIPFPAAAEPDPPLSRPKLASESEA
jgi:hypothetical protein